MTPPSRPDDPGLLPSLVGDGRALLSLTGLALAVSGAFAVFLSVTGAFLPQDVDFLGMEPTRLCALNQCRIVHFMFHDRVSFGGVLVSIAVLYLWLARFPLREGRGWAWWTFVASGTVGFLSFLCYLGYGYLDTWHGAATLVLLPLFGWGLAQSRRTLGPSQRRLSVLWRGVPAIGLTTRAGLGRALLLLVAAGLMGAGGTIMTVGMTRVFVPQDLAYIGMSREGIAALNGNLIPLIAHDRAGFGGGLFSYGVLLALVVLHGHPSRALWEALAASGLVGFGCAIGVHFCVGYLDASHLAPAFLGAALFLAGIILIRRRAPAPLPEA